MLVGKDCTVNLRFPVGRKYVIVAISFKQGEDSEDILRTFLLKENIPIYLENSLLAVVHNFLLDDMFLQEERDLIIDYDLMEQNEKEFSNLFMKTTKHYYKENLSHSNATISKFEREFSDVVNQSIPNCEMIIRAYEVLQSAFLKLKTSHKGELDDLYSNQSDEMNKAMGLDQSNISNLVVKHVKELEELELKFKEKINALKIKQRLKFREYISKLINASEKVEYAVFDPQEEDDKTDKRRNRRWFKLRDEPLEVIEQKEELTLEKLAPAASGNFGYEFSIPVSIGVKTPIVYSLQLTTSSTSSLIRRSIRDKKSLVKAARCLYKGGLSSYVIISEPNLSYVSKTTSEIVELNELSTELHFTSMNEQFAKFKDPLGRNNNNNSNNNLSNNNISNDNQSESSLKGSNSEMQMLNTGDVYITRHSNLGDAQVIFHLYGNDTKKSTITESSLHCSFESPLFIGLKNIFETAMQYDISSISLPLLLIDTLPEHLYNHPACLGRGITIMRAVKNLLLNSTDDTLKVVRFILPPVPLDVFEKYKFALKNIFTFQL